MADLAKAQVIETKQGVMLDITPLPMDAREQLKDFYEFLVFKVKKPDSVSMPDDSIDIDKNHANRNDANKNHANKIQAKKNNSEKNNTDNADKSARLGVLFSSIRGKLPKEYVFDREEAHER